MSEKLEPHPLDDFEFGKADPGNDSRTRAYKPLLKPSIAVAAIAFGLVFIASVLENNTPFGSIMQQLWLGVSRVSGIVMLAACCGILLAYRLPHFDAERLRSGALSAKGWLASGYVSLIVVNGLAIGFAWALIILLSGIAGPLLAILLSAWLICLPGLAATMAVIHKGYLRGYAIGMLTVLFLMFNSSYGMLMMAFSGGQFTGGPNRLGNTFFGSAWAFNMNLGMIATLGPFVGVVCAGYVLLVERFRRGKGTGKVTSSVDTLQM